MTAGVKMYSISILGILNNGIASTETAETLAEI